MSSEDSDDEPLSSFAAIKNGNQTENEKLRDSRTVPTDDKVHWDKHSTNVSIDMWSAVEEQTSVERPTDVWMYLKDFNATGPYSCLLCSEWFINKSKIVIHYVINHQKDYCGICRYFVPTREAWWEHQKFHTPWKCSQCSEMFMTQTDLREHFSNQHQLIHCRLCYLRVSDNDQYNIHLYQKHGVTNISSKHHDVFWDFEYEGSPKFICLLCMKPNTNLRPFVDHFLSYHHFTLKCLSSLICGTDLQLYIKGLDLTPEFIETQLKNIEHYGYVDLKKPIIKEEPRINENVMPIDCNPNTDIDAIDFVEESNINDKETYKGDEDYDITLLELIPIQNCYFEYINEILTQVTSNVMPQNSNVNYGTTFLPISCCYCPEVCKNDNAFIYHMSKMHFVRTLPKYSCRVCTNLFYTGNELKNHITEEMGEFEDLWLCQFCDKEFNNREETRKHLTEHWNVIEYDNCFSPHLGFKCSFCPTLFWNETDREKHHLRVHFERNKNSFYKCTVCDEMFGDRVWFTHHYIENHDSVLYLLKCCICCDVLNPNDARTHLIQYHPEARKIFCSMPPCKYKPFTQKKSFNMHLKTKHNPSYRSPHLTCGPCGQQFTSMQARAAHMSHKHGLSRCYKCNLCKETMKTMDERKMHYLLRHPGRYQHQCPLCDKSFRYKSSLYMHKQEHAPNKQHYTCDFCGKSFVKKDSYREHMQIHDTPRHACSYCPMRFVQRSNMLRHERRHTGERPYTCRLCPRTFADKGACTSHYRTHQKESAFACMYCNQTFVQKSKLTYHIRKHTGENLETCDICFKKFTSAGSLREHMKVHLRNKMKKTVKCPLCKRMYPDEQSMLRHMRASHSRGSHACPLCHRELISASSLREHIVTHAKVKMYRCRLCPKSYHSKRPILKHVEIRHKVEPNLINMTVHYRRLALHECKIGLDEATLKRIFSPSKRKNIIETPTGVPHSSQNEDQSEQSHKIEIKIEMEEPLKLDFVNVKSEFVNDDDTINDL